MADQNAQLPDSSGKAIVLRSQKMAAALSSYARALTFENRSRRNLYRLAGLAPKVRDRIFAKLLMISFVFCFVVPLGASVLYYVFLASSIYASEVRFVVRSTVPMLSRDRYSSETVEPKAKIVQDTAIILNYLESSAVIQDLQSRIDFKEYFGRDDIDFIARLPADAHMEDTVEYWSSRYSSWVNPKSGIVELEVMAFSPQEAFDLMNVVMNLAENRVNQLSKDMWDSLLAASNRDVQVASEDLVMLRNRYRDLQNETGIYDLSLAADGLINVLTVLETELAGLKSRRNALAESVNADAPQLLEIERQIAARVEQVTAMKSEAAGADGNNLAGYARRFDDLKLELSLGEDRLASAIGELEKVKLVSSLQLVYLDAFTEPTYPDTNKYPDLPLSLLAAFFASLVLWGSASGAIIFIRHKLD